MKVWIRDCDARILPVGLEACPNSPRSNGPRLSPQMIRLRQKIRIDEYASDISLQRKIWIPANCDCETRTAAYSAFSSKQSLPRKGTTCDGS
jgi:hypothetical protein